MGSIFRSTYTSEGKTHKCDAWSIKFLDHEGTRRSMTGFTDKRLTEAMLSRVEALVDIRRSKAPTPPDMQAWLEQISPDIRDRLAKLGVIDESRAAAARPPLDHVDDWCAWMINKGLDSRHIRQSVSQVRRVLIDCRFVSLHDIKADRFQEFLAEIRTDAAPRTVNSYLVSFKSYCNWLVKLSRLGSNPVRHISRLSESVDIRRERRALTNDEFGRLLGAAEAGGWFRMSGPDRSFLYLLAARTGYRWSEIGSLTQASFSMDTTPATVVVMAGDAKAKRKRIIPLHPDIEARLRERFDSMLPGAPLFSHWPKDRDGSKMVMLDLEAAGIPYQDEAGRYFDFHALRHQFGSMLAASGAPIKVAMELMGHKDVNLTMGLYSHMLIEDGARAIENLCLFPKSPYPGSALKLAAGAEADSLGSNLGQLCPGNPSKPLSTSTREVDARVVDENEKPPETLDNQRVSGGIDLASATGLEPATSRSTDSNRNSVTPSEPTNNADSQFRLGSILGQTVRMCMAEIARLRRLCLRWKPPGEMI